VRNVGFLLPENHGYFAFTVVTKASSVLSFTKFGKVDLGCRPNSPGGQQGRPSADERRNVHWCELNL